MKKKKSFLSGFLEGLVTCLMAAVVFLFTEGTDPAARFIVILLAATLGGLVSKIFDGYYYQRTFQALLDDLNAHYIFVARERQEAEDGLSP